MNINANKGEEKESNEKVNFNFASGLKQVSGIITKNHLNLMYIVSH